MCQLITFSNVYMLKMEFMWLIKADCFSNQPQNLKLSHSNCSAFSQHPLFARHCAKYTLEEQRWPRPYLPVDRC